MFSTFRCNYHSLGSEDILARSPSKTKIALRFHLYHDRHEETALLLHAPGAINVAHDGALTLTDHNANSMAVQSERLLFEIDGGRLENGDADMIALGHDTKGILHSSPVVLYLGYRDEMIRFGGKISIKHVDVH